MKNIAMLIIIPRKYDAELRTKKRISDFSTLPQIHERAMKTIRDFVSENVGYDNLPLASLRCAEMGSLEGVNFEEFLAVNSSESVLYQLEIPEDMIVSVEYDKLLNASANMFNAIDPMDIEMEAEELASEIVLGAGFDDSDNYISFIPFLDYDRCKFFVELTRDFRARGRAVNSTNGTLKLKTLSSFAN